MSCDRISLVQRLSVEDESALAGAEWQAHFDICGECRDEWNAFAQSLAVFRQLEAERIFRYTAVPSWEEFSKNLAVDWRRWWKFRHMRIPLAAAAVAMLTVGGVTAWLAGSEAVSPPRSAAVNDKPAPAVRQSRPVDVNRLHFVSQRPAGLIRRRGAGRYAPQTFVFELRSVNPRVAEANPRSASPPGGLSSPFFTINPAQQTQGSWRPPTATRIPGQPVRVDYPVHKSQSR